MPLLLDGIAPYTGNVAQMGMSEAIAYIQSTDEAEEIEVLCRLEFMGPNRDEVLTAAVDQYWATVGPPVKPPYPLVELRRLWDQELQNPESRRMYEMLLELTA